MRAMKQSVSCAHTICDLECTT